MRDGSDRELVCIQLCQSSLGLGSKRSDNGTRLARFQETKEANGGKEESQRAAYTLKKGQKR